MDESRFDGLTRKLANTMSRRHTLQGVAGSVLGGLLAHLGLEEASAACVKVGKKGCKGPQNKKCCQGATCKGGSKTKTGKCACKNSLTKCGPACVDTETSSEHCGGCDRACAAGEFCEQGTCRFTGGCRAGANYCSVQGLKLDCPDSNDTDCKCVTDFEGVTYCADTGQHLYCGMCRSNADCEESHGPGWVCYEAHFDQGCNCPIHETDPDTHGTGNACAYVGGSGLPRVCGR